MYVPDQYNDSVILEAEEQDYDDIHMKIPNLKNYDGREGRRKSSIVVDSLDNTLTGTLTAPSGGIKIKDGNNQVVINRSDIEKLYGSSGGNNGINNNKCVLYSSDGSVYANNYATKVGNNFVFLRARAQSAWRSLMIPNLGSGDATIIIDQTNQTINGDKTFSRAITMSQEGSANNHLVTKKYVDDEIAKIPSGSGSGNVNTSNFLKKDGSVAMTGDLNMNEQRVKNTLDPTDEQDTVNKRYLESQLNDYLKRNGQSPMTFDLNMNSYKIVNLKDINNLSIDSEAVNKKYVDDEIAKIPSANFLKKDGSVAMTGDLNMSNHKIKNTAAPTADGDVATKKYVDESHVTPSEHFGENAFRYLMEDVDESSSENNISVSGIARFDASIHQNDKNAYRITLIKDLGSNDYRSRIGFNLGSLPIGYYTFVCEFFPIVMSNVNVTALGTTISINSQATKTFPTYTKTVVQFHRWNSTPPQFIYLDLHGSEPSNARRILAHIVVYGVKGYFPNVPSSLFDQIYVVNNGRMVMQTDINMNNKRIEGLPNPINNSDAANKIYCDNFDYNIIYRKTFPLFYNLNETKNFNFIATQSGIAINKVNPNLILGTNRGLNDYNSGLKLSSGAYILSTDTFNQNSSFTLFISFQHDTTKTCEICWAGLGQNSLRKTYPRFRITNNQIIIDGGSRGTQTTNFPSRYQNKILPLWICFNGSNTYKMRLVGYAVTAPFQPPMNFQLNYLNIDFDVTVYKIGFIDQFIDINTLSYYQILFEEKRNGSLV